MFPCPPGCGRLRRRGTAWSPGALAAALTLLSCGCLLQNVSAEQKLQQAVHELNDDLRWHRVGGATERVDEGYRQAFVSSRRTWGQRLQIADAELMSLEMDDERRGATAVITFRWYSRAQMRLHQTVVQQKWKHGGRGKGFVLAAEKVLEGDGRLLEGPRSEQAESRAAL